MSLRDLFIAKGEDAEVKQPAVKLNNTQPTAIEIILFMFVIVIAALFIGYYTPHPLFK